MINRNRFDAETSSLARDAALAQVEAAASHRWKAEALDAIRYVAERRERFTTDAVWYVLEQIRKIEGPSEPRALGSVMRRAVSMGFCRATSEVQKSVRVDCHRRPLAVWESRLFKPQLPAQAGGT